MAEPAGEQSIFLHAIALPTPADRAAYLDDVCRDQPALRAELEALLAAHDRLGGALPPTGPEPAGVAAAAPAAVAPGTGASEAVGTMLAGRYRLLEAIGEGGMGTVWMARQTEPVKRLVAVKLIKPGMDSRAVLARFEQERQALALMDHPNIAKVLDAGTAPDGRPFFVMELVKGVPITRYCDEHRLTPPQRLELLVPVCQAIQHAHTKGIIHRDISPSNVLVARYDDQPVPKVIDFGIAKATGPQLTAQTVHTGLGAVVGTVEYMSPEQAGFNQLDVDTRSDVYALGVLLYELLTGSPPFSRQELETAGALEMLRLIREQEPPKPSTKLSTADGLPSLAANRGTEPKRLTALVRGELDWIVMKALEKERARRYETASGLARDIQRYLTDEPVEAGPPGIGYRLRKFARRYKKLLATAAAFLALLVVAAAVSTWLAVWALAAERDARAQQRQTQAALDRERDARADLSQALDDQTKALHALGLEKQATQRALAAEQRLTYVHRVALAQREWQANNVARADELLGNCPAELRHWEWHYLKRLCHAELLRLAGQSKGITGVAFHPDGKWLATSGWQELKIWDADAGKELVQFPLAEGWVSALAFSNDGARIVTAGFRTLTVWEARSGKAVVRIKAHEFLIRSVAFSPDGKRIASASGTPVGGGRQESGEVRLWDAASGKELLSFPGLPHWANTVAFSPDGKYLVAGLGDLAVLAPATPGEVRVWDAATGREIHTFRGHTFWVTSVAVSPDSRQLASAGADGTVRVWDLKTGQAVLTLRGHRRWVRAVAFSPDGKLLASAGDDQIVKLWDAATGNEVLTLRGHSHPVLAIAFGPDSRRLASASGPSNGPGEVKIWDITTSQEARTLRGHTAVVTSVAFSPDSKLLASVSESMSSAKPGEALIWDLAGGRQVATIRGHFLGFTRVTFSPDGLMIATAGGEGVEFWERVTGQRLLVLPLRVHPTFGLALSPDGKWVAASGVGGVVVWDRATGKEQLNFRAHTLSANGLAFSPDSRHLATCTWGGNYSEGVGQPVKQAPNEVKVWDVETGKELRALRGGGLAVVYRPRGEQLASSNPDGSVQVWDSATGQELFRLGGHSAAVRSLAYSPDGQRILTGSDDSTVKVWDALTGQEVLTLRGHNEPVTAVAFSPDGRQIASGSGDRGEPGTVKVWDATPAPR
jgi:WD40 repeat protein